MTRVNAIRVPKRFKFRCPVRYLPSNPLMLFDARYRPDVPLPLPRVFEAKIFRACRDAKRAELTER